MRRGERIDSWLINGGSCCLGMIAMLIVIVLCLWHILT